MPSVVALLAAAAPAQARIQLGLASEPGAAAKQRAQAPFGFRYQYLAGGVNTGDGWAGWNDPKGTFVDRYIGETEKNLMVPVFSYYMIRQSLPGRDDSNEPRAVLDNLKNEATMRDWYADVKLFLKHAGRFPKTPVVLHLEPDMWGYAEQAGRDLGPLARRVVRMRDKHAPNVLLAYHLSVWGTGVDISISDPSNEETDRLARKAGRYYRSLDAKFDLTFTDWSDRDAGFKQAIYGAGPEAWWTGADHRRAVRFIRAYSRKARQRVAVWQLPLGNTRRSVVNNTWGHYQDNHVQWLLGKGNRDHLRSLARAGGLAVLFGGGADGTTCACDADGNGADDDGGYFRARGRAYYDRGPLRLP